MKGPLRHQRAQQGAALILFVTVLVLGVAWYTVGALGKAPVATAEREVKTGLALQAAKQALLAHAAQYAARFDTADPGQLPCPESVTLANPGVASTSCSNATATAGRLPWKTLGIDELRDGGGELLWYVLSPGFRDPPINFGSVGQLSYDGAANAAVALIIAPGRALYTLSDPAVPPAGCSKVNQQVATRYAAPLDPANYLECGNASGPSYANPGTSQWSNDRVLAITAAEWIEAIAGPVADRLQRQLAPALSDWRTTESVTNWGVSFLPYASTFSDPTANNLCGNNTVREGLSPATKSASSTCTSWTGGNITDITGTLLSLGCSQVAGNNYRCLFLNASAVTPLTARIRATAPNVGGSFRGRIVGAPPDITDDRGGTISNFSLSIDTGSGDGDLDFRISFPLLAFLQLVTVTIKNLPDAAVVSDARAAWFFNNDWGRYTYYVLGRGNRLSGGSPCSGPGDNDCLVLNGLPASNGNADDKQLILALMGRALPAIPQTRPPHTLANYLESRINATDYNANRITSTFNDRLAACPFKYVDAGGSDVAICN